MSGCYSVNKSYLTLCDPMNCNMPGFPVLYYLWVCSNSCPWSWLCHLTNSSFIIPFCSCPQSFPASESFPISSPLFPKFRVFSQWVGSLHQVTKVLELELELQHQSFQWIQGWLPLGLTGLISLLSKGFSRVFSSTTIQKHHFFNAQTSLWSNSYICTWLQEKP